MDERIIRQLATEDYLIGLRKQDFAAGSAKFVNEINACHPFIDGNGRTQRFWLRMLADNAGFYLDLNSRDSRRWNDASHIGFLKQDHEPMAGLIRSRLRRLG